MNTIARVATGLLATLLSSPLSVGKAYANYVPMGTLADLVPSGQNFIGSSEETPNATAISGGNAPIPEYLQQMVILPLYEGGLIKKYYAPDIPPGYRSASTNHGHADLKAAKPETTSAIDEANALQRNAYFGGHSKFLRRSANLVRSLVEMASAIYRNGTNPDQSANGSRRSSGETDDYVRATTAGIALLEAAQNFRGFQYKPGMTCNVLIIQAIRQASMYMTTGNTTSVWFNKGFGSDFRQVYGGANGLPLGRLVDDLNNNKVDISLGSIIVQDGHAAFYAGQIKIADEWEIITYDANDQSGWAVTREGQFFRSDAPAASGPDPVAPTRFPGRQVGEHVTRLQWAHSHLVKVFQPVADSPSDHRFE